MSQTSFESILRTVREALDEATQGAVDAESLAADASLYDSGMTSHQAVQLMLEVEDRFDIEFPESKMVRTTFASLRTVAEAVADTLGVASEASDTSVASDASDTSAAPDTGTGPLGERSELS